MLHLKCWSLQKCICPGLLVVWLVCFSEDGVEDNMEAQEILEDQLARQLTREYIDLLGKS